MYEAAPGSKGLKETRAAGSGTALSGKRDEPTRFSARASSPGISPGISPAGARVAASPDAAVALRLG
jgi:hypothetical protein